MNQNQIKSALYTWLSSVLGVRREFTITFNADFVTGNVINATFGTDSITVNFDTDHATTLQALQDAIQRTDNIFKAVVSGARQITCTVNAVGTTPVVTGPTVTGGASQAVATIAQTVAPVAITVIFSDQNSPRPNYPYAVIRLDSFTQLGWDEWRETDPETCLTTIGGQRRATVSINFFGVSAFTELSKAYNSLDAKTVQMQLYQSGIAIGDKNDVQNLTAMLESKWEERSFFDFFIFFADNYEDDLGVIETVGETGTFDGGAQGDYISGPIIIGQ